MTTNGSRAEAHFRADLEGLRGVAILLVLLCHIRLPGAEAGFIGVDVFFVLSGFLITGLLIGERERTGGINLIAFYTRRVRRIFPAAALVLATTLVAAQFLISPLDRPRIGVDIGAAGLSMANIRFALGATDYFASTDPSPVLHYWSLGVEEQFYLLWPVLLVAAARLARPRTAMALLCVAIVVGSFLLSFALTSSSAASAYYLLPARAWQLAIGGLLALAGVWLGRTPGPMLAATGWLGVGLLVAAVLVIGPMTPYPGVASLLPTIGAVAIIASRGVPGSPGPLLLERAPLRWLGRISFSLYLWHWPILVFGATALGLAGADAEPTASEFAMRLALVGVAAILAHATWRFVEEPFRRGLTRQPGRAHGSALAAAVVVTMMIGSTVMGADAPAGIANSPSLVEPPGYAEDAVAAALEASAQSSSSRTPRPTDVAGSGNAAPLPTPNAAPLPTPTGVVVPSASPAPKPTSEPTPRIEGSLPDDLAPSLAAARGDDDPLVRDGCGLALAGWEPPRCVYGDQNGSLTVALVGDSHASHWFPAIERLARQRGWRLVPFTKYSCVFVDMPIWNPVLKREYTECETWREVVVGRLVDLQPDLVIVASNQWFPVIVDHDNEPVRQGAAMARLIDRLPGTVAILVDTPRSDVDVPACLAQHRDAIERCTTARSAAFGWRHKIRETEAARLSGATVVDLSDSVCPSDPCPPIIGSTLVYLDHHHLTVTFARTLAGVFGRALPAFGQPKG